MIKMVDSGTQVGKKASEEEEEERNYRNISNQ